MNKNIIYVFLVFLASCTFQKSVIVDPPNLCNFKYEKEKNLKIASNNLSLNFQGNYAFSKCFGAGLNLYSGAGDFNSKSGSFNGTDASLTFYKHFNEYVYFELQTGYGICRNNSSTNYEDMGSLLEYGVRTTYTSNTTYQKTFLQPELSFTLKRISINSAVKISGLYFNHYYYDYNSWDNSNGDEEVLTTEGSVTFNNKTGLVIEDIKEFKFGDCFFIQLVTSFSLHNIQTGTATSYYGGGYMSDKTINFSNPNLWPFKVFVGFDIKLGKNKKPLNF